MWIKAYNGNLISINGKSIYLQKRYPSGNGVIYIVIVGDFLVYQSKSEVEAQKVLDYIWQRLEMGKKTCDIGKFKNADAEKSAKWPGCAYDDVKETIHRNFEYEGIPEVGK